MIEVVNLSIIYIVISIFWYWINWHFEAKKGSKYHEISRVWTAILNNAIWKTCVGLSSSTVLAGDLVLFGARASVGIVMTTFGVRPTPPQTDGTFFSDLIPKYTVFEAMSPKWYSHYVTTNQVFKLNFNNNQIYLKILYCFGTGWPCFFTMARISNRGYICNNLISDIFKRQSY